jgi:rSAM/selenodomain-associated transferase 2/rSAM/selenodomain-associated transferase 1
MRGASGRAAVSFSKVSDRRLILFARYPVAGRVKTRLVPALGAEGAAGVHRRLVLRTLRTAARFCAAEGIALEIRFDGGSADAVCHWLGDAASCRPQCEGDLGQRMADAFEASFAEGARATAIVGCDVPALGARALAGAFDALARGATVLGPATDGGYYLVGLTRPAPELFRGIAWGTDQVLPGTLRALARRGEEPVLLEPLADLDRPEDLPAWEHLVAAEEESLARISVVIPALNEARAISATLGAVRSGGPHEVFVVDGGSTDATARLARDAGAIVLTSPPGRARQMNAGAARATGNVLLFVHADTRLPERWPAVVAELLRRPGVAAGAFRFSIDGAFPGKRLVEAVTGFRSRWLQRPYGDQGLFLRRALFETCGGFANLPLLEDYELVTRLRRHGRVATAAAPALTSARRWRELGVLRTTWINQRMLAGYHRGTPPDELARIYRGAGKG